jgi:hypothetical protein
LKWSRLLSACIGVTIGTGNGVRVVKRAGSDIGTGTGGKLATLVGRKFGRGTGTKVVNGVGGWNGSVAGGTGNVNGQFSIGAFFQGTLGSRAGSSEVQGSGTSTGTGVMGKVVDSTHRNFGRGSGVRVVNGAGKQGCRAGVRLFRQAVGFTGNCECDSEWLLERLPWMVCGTCLLLDISRQHLQL